MSVSEIRVVPDFVPLDPGCATMGIVDRAQQTSPMGFAMTEENELARIVALLADADSHEEEAQIGRSELASLLFHASPQLLDGILKAARRDNRMRRCLAAARYYSGLSQEKCDKIDAVLQAPFPKAAKHRK